jgi:RNA polymerase sigma-70 factor (ECF subfamily)
VHADPPTSVSLLQRLRTDDQEAWQRLYKLYAPLVAHWCQRGGVRAADIDDVCQDVFRAVAGGLSGFRRERPGDTFRGWLHGITRFKVVDHFRKNQRNEGEGGSDAQRRLLDLPVPEMDDNDEVEISSLYHRALEMVRAEFEERTWQAFWRVAIDGLTPAVVASELGVSAAAIRQAKSRILRRLKEEVGDLIA